MLLSPDMHDSFAVISRSYWLRADGSVSPTLVLDADEIDLTSPDAALPGIRRRQLRARQPVETASRTPRRSALRRTLRGRSAARRGRSARVRQIRQPPNPLTQRRWVCLSCSLWAASQQRDSSLYSCIRGRLSSHSALSRAHLLLLSPKCPAIYQVVQHLRS